MSLKRLGVHDLTGGPAGIAWAKVANVVKSCDSPGAISHARQDAIVVFRPRSWTPVEQDGILQRLDTGQVVTTILDRLAGFRHPNLYVETLNEVGAGHRARYIEFLSAVVPMLHDHGLKVAGPSWATGDYGQDDWEHFRSVDWCGLDAIALHAYWSSAGLTQWNALRYRSYHNPSDPPVLVTECGRDRVRDGPTNVDDGWLPQRDGDSFGWQAASQNCTPGQFLAECIAFDAELAKDPYVLGATLFSTSCNDEWLSKGFNCDGIAADLAARTVPWAPDRVGASTRPVSTPAGHIAAPAIPSRPAAIAPAVSRPNGGATMPPIVNRPALPDLCPFANYMPLYRNFDTDGTAPKIVVWHGTAGLGDPYNWWNRQVASNQAASADFWISREGVLKQYVKLVTQTSWSNGPLAQPDLTVPFLAWLVAYRRTHPEFTGNWWTASVEMEKGTSNTEEITPAQLATGRRLALWMRDEYAIPLDRHHHLGHYQFDSVSRSRCPGPLPWDKLLAVPVPDSPAVIALRDTLWVMKDAAWTLNRQELGDAIEHAVRADKGEVAFAAIGGT